MTAKFNGAVDNYLRTCRLVPHPTGRSWPPPSSESLGASDLHSNTPSRSSRNDAMAEPFDAIAPSVPTPMLTTPAATSERHLARLPSRSSRKCSREAHPRSRAAWAQPGPIPENAAEGNFVSANAVLKHFREAALSAHAARPHRLTKLRNMGGLGHGAAADGWPARDWAISQADLSLAADLDQTAGGAGRGGCRP